MKIRVINILEIVVFVLFTASYFIQKIYVAHLGYFVLGFYLLLGALYFPLGFYTLKSPKFNVIYSIIFGMLFSGSLTAIFLSLAKVDLSIVLLLLVLVFYIMAAATQAIAFYFFDIKQEGQIIMYDYPMTARYLVFFVFMIYALVTYSFRG